MKRKDAPDLDQIKLTATSEVDDVDDVVCPFVPEAESEIQTGKPIGIRSAFEREASAGRLKLSHKVFSLAKRFSIVLGVVLAAALCAIMWKQRQADEEQLQYYNDQAELAEFDSKPDKAALFWRQGIKLSESLHSDRWAVADLHMRAATAEAAAWAQPQLDPANQMRLANGIQIDPSTLNSLKKFKDDQKEDLLAALHIYQHTNAKAEQLTVLRDLVATCQVPQCVYYDPYRDPNCNQNAPATNSLPAAKIPEEPDKNDIDKTVANYRTYLLTVGDSAALSGKMKSLLGSLETPQQYEKVIPLLQEYCYEAIEPENFLKGHRWLDRAIEKSGKSKDGPGSRLALANDAYARGDFHGAIVEYSRYLANNKKDEGAREKLLSARRLNRQKSIGSGPDLLLEQISFLKELRTLENETFGFDSSSGTTLSLVDAYSLAEDVRSAESELAPLLKKVEKRIPLKHAPVDFAATLSAIQPPKFGNGEEAADIFRASADIATQKAMYESAVHDLEYSALAIGWPAAAVAGEGYTSTSGASFERWTSARSERETFANLCTCRGLYNIAQHHLPTSRGWKLLLPRKSLDQE